FLPQFQELRISATSDRSENHPEGGAEGAVVAEEWFTPKKRALLAPFGVGTVDQALLSVMRVKHGFVRLFGLGGKAVIVDEVHAYDTYTSTLLERLLAWLGAMGSPVILMSATLPAARRQALVKAYAGRDVAVVPTRYPRLTWVSSDGSDTIHFAGGPIRKIELEWQVGDRAEIASRLVGVIRSGGCAAWICNTVGQAQETYETLQRAATEAGLEVGSSGGDSLLLDLFHAHYPYRERQRREARSIEAFGKEAKSRPERAILVATQVVEQSLDVDFDLIVTEMAPVDLILQRAGRLHRHPKTRRPKALSSPRLWMVAPPAGEQGPSFGSTSHIYDEYVLLKSWLALCDRTQLNLPADTEELIEGVYAEDEPAGVAAIIPARGFTGRLQDARRRMEQARVRSSQKGAARLIKAPSHPDNILYAFDVDLEEEDPTVHEAFRALTRQGVSIQVICLHAGQAGPALDPEGRFPVDLSSKPGPYLVQELLLNSMRLSHEGLFRSVAALPVPAGWRRCAYLRHSRPLIFHAGRCELGGWQLSLHDELGLVISKEGGEP
ncbi:MAG: CRISPR-associated helicase Cas3', partial [Bacillota bacterium]